MKSILITGTSGFIGSRLAIRCTEAGLPVIATSRQPSPELAHSLKLPVRPLDVLDPAIADLDVEADTIIHCATPSDVISRDFAAGLNLSVNGTRHVLELAVKNSIKRVIFFSTLQVYGTELNGEITESTSPRCETPYGLNHLLGEEVCRMYAHRHGLDIVLMRPANVYGVPDSPTVNRAALVPMCFVKEALAEGSLTLKSSGRQHRNFVSTDEVADACLHLVKDFPAGANVINVGSQWQASIREVAELVAETSHRRHGKTLPLKIGSDQPAEGNQFTVQSRLDHLRMPAAGSRSRMEAVIDGLFDYFQHRQKLAA